MEIEYIFPCRIFDSKKSACIKVLTERKTVFMLQLFLKKIDDQ